MDPELILRWLHVIGACVLLGTGAGIAFFMMMAHRSGDTALIAGTARIVVIADMAFTATAVLAQPLTGWSADHRRAAQPSSLPRRCPGQADSHNYLSWVRI